MIKSAAIEAKRYYEGINMEMEQIPCLAASQRQHEIGKVGAFRTSRRSHNQMHISY